MAFNQERFDKLIQKLEVFAAKQPLIYRLHVAFLAVLGYAYIFSILALTVALLVGIVWMMLNGRSFRTPALKLVIFLLALVFILLRSLWVSFPPPIGLKLRRQDAPNLFSLVDDISSKLQAPRFHHILLTEDFSQRCSKTTLRLIWLAAKLFDCGFTIDVSTATRTISARI